MLRITIQLIADVLELRCGTCHRLLETVANSHHAYVRPSDFMDHLCPAPLHQAAPARINPQIGR